MYDIWRRSRRPIAVGVCIGVLVALVVVKLTTPRNFEARAAVDLDPDELPRGLLRSGGELDVPKLHDALHGDAVLHDLIVRGLPIPPGLEAERRLTDRVRSRLVCNYTTRTRNTIDLRYHDRDPGRAAEIVNRFARLFGEENIVPVAGPPVVQVSPSHKDYVALGILGGHLGGLFVLVGCVVLERFAREH